MRRLWRLAVLLVTASLLASAWAASSVAARPKHQGHPALAAPAATSATNTGNTGNTGPGATSTTTPHGAPITESSLTTTSPSTAILALAQPDTATSTTQTTEPINPAAVTSSKKGHHHGDHLRSHFDNHRGRHFKK